MILFDIGIIKFRNQEVGGSTPLSGIVESIGYKLQFKNLGSFPNTGAFYQAHNTLTLNR